MNNEAMKTPTAKAKKNKTVDGVFPTKDPPVDTSVSSSEVALAVALSLVTVVVKTMFPLVVNTTLVMIFQQLKCQEYKKNPVATICYFTN